MGLSSLTFGPSGICQLVLNSDLLLTLYRPDGSARLVVFGQLPAPILSVEAAKELLKRNRSNAALAAPVISLSPDEEQIEVHLVLDSADLADDGADTAIEQIIATLERCRSLDHDECLRCAADDTAPRPDSRFV